MNESICVIDFAGNYSQPGEWCDYYPDKKKVVFGGYWHSVPDLLIDHLPTEEECDIHAVKYLDICKKDYENYIKNSE